MCTADARETRAVCIFNHSFADALLRELDWPKEALERTELKTRDYATVNIVTAAKDRRYQEFESVPVISTVANYTSCE